MGAGVSFLDSEKHMILTKRQSALTFYHTAIGVLQDLDRVCKRRPANRWWGRRRQVSCLGFEQMTDRISLRTRNTLLCMLRFLGVLTSAFLPPSTQVSCSTSNRRTFNCTLSAYLSMYIKPTGAIRKSDSKQVLSSISRWMHTSVGGGITSAMNTKLTGSNTAMTHRPCCNSVI